MKLTTKGQYAIVAMTYIKRENEKGFTMPVRLSEISKKEGISLQYLEQLFSKLRKSNLVSSVRGPGGGYVLSEGAISYGRVLRAVEEKIEFRANLGHLDGTSITTTAAVTLTSIQNDLIESFNSTMI